MTEAAWEGYAHGSEVEHFAEFCERFLTQSVDEWDGLPLVLEPFQLRMMGEALAYDAEGWPVWRSVVIVMPRKNGKTQLLAAYAVYRLATSDGSPEILLAASSDKQAGRLFNAAATFVRRNPRLAGMMRVRDHAGEIVREDGLGVIYRLSSDPGRLHGYNPSLVVADELAHWTTPTLKRAYAALTSGGGARRAPQTFTITVAGEAQDRSSSILGRILDAAAKGDDVVREPGLLVSRLAPSRMLVWNYEAPTSDPRDARAMKLANPASWISEEKLAFAAANPELTDAEVLQLHGCVWAEGVDAWIPAAAWQGCHEPHVRIPERAPVMVGVDVALVHDSTAVAVAWARPDGRTVVEAEVWAVNPNAVAHHHLHGDSLDLEVIEAALRALARRYQVQAVLYDPRFFERSAQMLSSEGLVVAQFDQNTKAMRDAYHDWYSAVLEQRVVHADDPVLTSHVMATAASKTDMGWKIGRVRQSRHIDAHVAAVQAYFGATHATNFVRQKAWHGSW